MSPPPTVLVVDDSRAARMVAARTIESLGYAVEAVGSGPEALERIAHDPSIGVVVTDIVMPQMSGLSLMAFIRSQFAKRKIYLIALTVEQEDVDIRNIREHGAVAVLSKPLDRIIFRDLADQLALPRRDMEQSSDSSDR